LAILKTPVRIPVGGASKKKRCGTGLTQRVSNEDGSSGNDPRVHTNGQAYREKFSIEARVLLRY